MTKAGPSSSASGSCPADATLGACCLARRGSEEISGNYSSVFREFGRSTSWFTSASAATANLPNGVTWDSYYYSDNYRFLLAYTTTASLGTGFTGTIDVTLRVYATVHPIPPQLTAVAGSLFRPVTAQTITAAFTTWNSQIQTHWTNRNYTVELGAPDCPGVFNMKFSVAQAASASQAHVSFTVLDMTHPSQDPTWAPILSNPADPQHATAQDLAKLWRSHAGKINLGDVRPTLFAHEYGHWMGWGDEYIEVSTTITDQTNPSQTVVAETRGGSNVSIRVAVRFKNPTRVYQSANGTDLEAVDITTSTVEHGLMAGMTSPLQYPRRFVYTIVYDFIRVYNQNHYGGGNTAYCNNVR